MTLSDVEFLNNPNICVVCFKKPETEPYLIGRRTVPLIKHHITYFPEKIAYVHYLCHRKIHDTPLQVWIQYEDGDARKFYDLQKQNKLVKKDG